MRKTMLALAAIALTLMGCSSIAGPDDEAASAAKAKRALDAAAQDGIAPSVRIAAN